MTATPTLLAPRRCHLRESDHRYVWQPTGEEMATSVTGVRDFFKDPDRFSKIALKDLKTLLKKFVKEEDYEAAAKVRDELSKRK